jgi:GH24 family phage-related lysozyme (muramidase)
MGNVAHINNVIKAKLIQYQFDALVSFVYNVGNILATTYCHLDDLIKSDPNDYKRISNKFLEYNKVGGLYNIGVDNRRHDEVELYCNGNYSSPYKYGLKTIKNGKLI